MVTRGCTHTHFIHTCKYTHTNRASWWASTASLQVCRLHVWSLWPGRVWSCKEPQPAPCIWGHTPWITSAVQITLPRVLLWCGKGYKQQKHQENNLRSHFRIGVTKRRLVRTLKTPWREEAIMPPKNMNKHIPERRGGKNVFKKNGLGYWQIFS